MKIVVTSIGGGADSEVDPRFGRASTFVFFDTDTENYVNVDNTVGVKAAQGAGVRAAEAISQLGAEVLITGHCGPKAFRTLRAAGIEAYTVSSGSVSEAIEHFKYGGLTSLSGPDVGGHWG